MPRLPNLIACLCKVGKRNVLCPHALRPECVCEERSDEAILLALALKGEIASLRSQGFKAISLLSFGAKLFYLFYGQLFNLGNQLIAHFS